MCKQANERTNKQTNKQTGKQDNNNNYYYYYYTRAEETNTSSTTSKGSQRGKCKTAKAKRQSVGQHTYMRMSSPRVQGLTNNTPRWANGTRAGFRRMDCCLVQIPIAVLETLGLGACRKRLSYYCVRCIVPSTEEQISLARTNARRRIVLCV